MTNAASNTSIAKSETAAQAKQVILKDVGAKWGKFSEQDLSALKGKDDLVKEVVAKQIRPREWSGSARCRCPVEGSPDLTRRITKKTRDRLSKLNAALCRLVNDFVFANLKLTGHNWRDQIFPSPFAST